MDRSNLASLVAAQTLDAELAALLWLLAEGGTPLVVTGSASLKDRSAVASAILSASPSRAWLLLDADDESPTAERLSASLRSGVGLGLTLGARDLRGLLSRLEHQPGGLPKDAVRRLGVVLVLERTETGMRVPAVHYLRPAERDAEGHVQRRPPAVLATWDSEADGYEHFAWGITPELADRVGRSQADFEERQHCRAELIAAVAVDSRSPGDRWGAAVASYLASEPPAVPAPLHEPARPSPFQGGLTDSDQHTH